MANHAGDAKMVLIIYIPTIYSPVSPPTKVQELLGYPGSSQTFPHLPPGSHCYHRDMVLKCMETPHSWPRRSRSYCGFPNLYTVVKGMTFPKKIWGYAQIKPKDDNKKRLVKSTAGHSKLVRRDTFLKERRWLVAKGFRNHHCDSKWFTLMAELPHYLPTLPKKIKSAGRFKQGRLTILLLQINLCFKGKTWS